jgi:hypothetical protein
MAAICWVTACRASRTRPVAPLPSVFPRCHGPTWVFLLPPFVYLTLEDAWEDLLLSVASSSTTVDTRLFSIDAPFGPTFPRTERLPSAFKDSWWGMRGEGVDASFAGFEGVGCGVTRGCRSASGRLEEVDLSDREVFMTKGECRGDAQFVLTICELLCGQSRCRTWCCQSTCQRQMDLPI